MVRTDIKYKTQDSLDIINFENLPLANDRNLNLNCIYNIPKKLNLNIAFEKDELPKIWEPDFISFQLKLNYLTNQFYWEEL